MEFNYVLLVKYLIGSLSSEEMEEVMRWRDLSAEAVWRFNQLVFENTTLREIANQLSIKYNVNVNIESSRLAQRRFRCVINEDERLPDVLEQLCYLAPITYRIESSEIYISEKQTKK